MIKLMSNIRSEYQSRSFIKSKILVTVKKIRSIVRVTLTHQIKIDQL